jgi:hypothetical protein
MRRVDALSGDAARLQNAIYEYRIRIDALSAIFHISRDNAILDNIAVLSGSRSSGRVLAACDIKFFSLGWRMLKCNIAPINKWQKPCQSLILLKTLSFFLRFRSSVNFADTSGLRMTGAASRGLAASRAPQWAASQ